MLRMSPNSSSVCEPDPLMIVCSGPRVLSGSFASREAKPMEGEILVLDMLYPSAISPTWSIAILPVQRKVAVSGAKVDCWATVGVPFGFCISYHRTPLPGASGVPTDTEWFTNERFMVPKIAVCQTILQAVA